MLPTSFTPSFLAFVVCSYVSVYATTGTGLEEPAEVDRRIVATQTRKVREMFKVQPDAPINVLSVDGGGVRGVVPATVLQMAEERTHKTVKELFDLVVGTSTGGILSLGLMTDDPWATTEAYPSYRTAEDMLGIYTGLASSIFPRRGLLRKTLEFFPSLFYRYQYSPRPLESGLLRYFADRTLGDTILPTVVTTVEVGYNKLRLFRSYRDSKILVRDAAYATSAAPSYFPSCRIGGMALCDGGVAANNPALIALTEAYNLFPGREINLISLGTGEPVEAVTTSDLPFIKLAASITNTLFAAQSDGVHAVLSNLDAGYRTLSYNRIQIGLPTELAVMDNSSNCTALCDITRNSREVQRNVEAVSRTLTDRRFLD